MSVRGAVSDPDSGSQSDWRTRGVSPGLPTRGCDSRGSRDNPAVHRRGILERRQRLVHPSDGRHVDRLANLREELER